MQTLRNKNTSNTCGFIVPCSKMYFPSPCLCTLFILLREQLSGLSLWIFQASSLHLINWTNTLLSLSPSCCHSALTLSWKISTSSSRKQGLCPLHTTFISSPSRPISLPSKGHFGWGFQNAGEGFSVDAELPASLPRLGCFSDRGDKRPQGLLSSVDSLFSFCLLRGNSLRGYWRENICGR